jgi:hypothetical protein
MLKARMEAGETYFLTLSMGRNLSGSLVVYRFRKKAEILQLFHNTFVINL